MISGTGGHSRSTVHFAPPTLEAAVVPEHSEERTRLWLALSQLAEQDPLIAVRRSDVHHQLTVSLFGEVQKEVLAATLLSDFGLRVSFRATTPLCIERPTSVAEALEVLHSPTNPYAATLGARLEPAGVDAGVTLVIAVEHEVVPLGLYKRMGDFAESMRQYVDEALLEGPFGWSVTDCTVTITACDYGRNDGPPSKRGPAPSIKDFRGITSLVVRQAVLKAATTVCEPVVRGIFEVPSSATGSLVTALSRLGVVVQSTVTRGRFTILEAVLPVVHANELQRQLPRLTSGEGVLETVHAGYAPVSGPPPTRPRASRRTPGDPTRGASSSGTRGASGS